jgi:hypothetical protein|eukprot:SAG25_NODE_974_length_4472_cov_2.144523_4_plen_58_part_00
MFAKSQIDVLACPAAQAPAHYDVRAQHQEMLLVDTPRSIREYDNGRFTVRAHVPCEA